MCEVFCYDVPVEIQDLGIFIQFSYIPIIK